MDYKPASTFAIEQLAALQTAVFANYVAGPINATPETVTRFFRRSGVDMDISQIFTQDDQPVGFSYISRRGKACRLAAFGFIPTATGAGIGTRTLKGVIEDAKARGDETLELEVIEQNEPAVRLYVRAGFENLGRLYGWESKSPRPLDESASSDGLEVVPIEELAQIVSQYGTADLPWQAAGFSLALFEAPDTAYRLDQAYVMITSPEIDPITIRTLIVLPEHRRQGQASRILDALFVKFPEKNWNTQVIFPEALEMDLMGKYGFTRLALNQFQMRLTLV